MLNTLRTLLARAGGSEEGTTAGDAHDQTLAAAVLLVEAAHLDGHQSEEEIAAIRRILQTRFALSEEDCDILLATANQTQEEAVELHQFTRKIKTSYSYDQRLELIEMLWEVVYADGTLHDFEANLLRRVGGLLHVSDRDRGEARRRVLEKLKNTSN